METECNSPHDRNFRHERERVARRDGKFRRERKREGGREREKDFYNFNF